MARRRQAEDPKTAALREARCLNPRPEMVTDERFAAAGFFDTRDLVQVKYEMVRAVREDDVPVTQAAAAFGFSRQSYYGTAAALEAGGLPALVPAKPGPKKAHKLTAQVCAFCEQQLAADPALRPKDLSGPIEAAFSVRVHPRSIERALARYRIQHSKSGSRKTRNKATWRP
jgi:transposase